jgi:hypothetical protein
MTPTKPVTELAEAWKKAWPPTPELATCGAKWATEGKWLCIPCDGSPSYEKVGPVRPSVSIEFSTNIYDFSSGTEGVYLRGSCVDGHHHVYKLIDGKWSVEK